ncbi:MAG: nucleotidyltransferase family protein [Planctomycetota bacterium]|nr:nucleotidyltransferase family protein [Planctomycetota bacterium]
MRALWPHLPASSIRLAQARLASVTKSVLNPSATTPVMEVADAAELAATGVAAFLCGVGPLLGYWIEHGQLRAQQPVARLLAEHLRQGRLRAAMLEEHLVQLLRDFRGRNITPIVLKGMVTARRYFPEPGTRPASDIDLLIDPHQLPVAKHVLRQAAFVEHSRSWKSTTWLLPEMSGTVRSLELDHAENPWSVDLHTSVDYQYFRGVWARFGELPWTNVGLDEVGGQELHCLTQPLLSAYLAQHASLHINHLRLIRIVELVAVLRRDLARGTLEWDALSRLLTRASLWRFVYPALESTERLSPGLLDPKFRRKLQAAATPYSRRVVERAAANGWGGWSSHWLDRVEEKLAWSQGPRELAMNLLELVLPSGVPVSQVLAVHARRVRLLAQQAA